MDVDSKSNNNQTINAKDITQSAMIYPPINRMYINNNQKGMPYSIPISVYLSSFFIVITAIGLNV